MNFFLHKNNLLVVGFLILLSACCQTPDKIRTHVAVNLSVQQDFQFDSTFNTIIIKNDKDYPITFRMKINEIFPLEMSDINNKIKQISTQNSVSKAQATWEFVSENTFWNKPYTAENWQHNPLLFLNSLGGGMCDDIASVLASLWKHTYDSVRVVGLEGHVISEVKENDKWQMFDADNGVAYLNSNGQIYSVNELENQAGIIAVPQKEAILSFNPFFTIQSPLTNRIADLYATTENNRDATAWHLDFANYSDTFSLPAHSSIEISNIGNRVRLKVVLDKQSVGKLQIPFIPYSASGSFIFTANNKSDTVQNNTYTFNSNNYTNELGILQTTKTSEITYLVNPKLNFWQAINSIKISTTNHLIIEKANLTDNTNVYLFGDEGFFFDKHATKYSNEITKWSKIGITSIDFQTMEMLFSQFLDIDRTLTKQQKEQKTAMFRRIYKQVFDGVNSRQVIFYTAFPKSMLYLFVALKEDKINFLYLI